MNNTFKISRLGLLIKKQWIENRRTYFITTAILFGFIVLIYLFNIFIDSYTKNLISIDSYQFLRFSSLSFRIPTLVLSGIFYLCLLAGHYFSNLGKASTAIQELTLPVSTIERLVCSFLLTTVLTLLTFVSVFLIVDTSAVSILKEVYKDIDIDLLISDQNRYSYGIVYGFKSILQSLGVIQLIVLPLFALFLSSVFTLGSIYFSRLSFIKTSFVVILFLGIAALSVVTTERTINNGLIAVQYPRQNETLISLNPIILILIIGSIWAAIYFRLKEKEA